MTDEGSRTTHEATALHEAGHAVAHVRLLDALGNALISHISIVPNPDANTLGHMSAEDDPCDASVAAATVTVLCAGYAALVAAGYEDKEARDGAWSDFERAQELIDAWKLDPLEACMGKAVMLMLEDRNINAVRTVASEVLVKRRLDGDYIHALILNPAVGSSNATYPVDRRIVSGDNGITQMELLRRLGNRLETRASACSQPARGVVNCRI